MNDVPQNTTRTVYYFNWVAHASYLEVMAQHPEIELVKFVNDSPDAEVEEVMARAHAFQIDSARATLAEKFWATPALLAKNPNLLCISTGGAGYDTVDVDACTEAGILVCNQTGLNREAVAEHALGLILSVSKRITETDRHLRAGIMEDRANYMGDEVKGQTLGVVGCGNTGSTLAKMCVAALDMTVLAYDPYVEADVIEGYGAEKVGFNELLERADYVSVHTPYTSETAGMFDAAAFAKMKPTAYFIITARGGIADEEALHEALTTGGLKGAGLDVWQPEPPVKEHPLLALDNVVATPHTAGSTGRAREALGREGANQLLDVLEGKRPPRLVNPDAWEKFVARYEELLGPVSAASDQ